MTMSFYLSNSDTSPTGLEPLEFIDDPTLSVERYDSPSLAEIPLDRLDERAIGTAPVQPAQRSGWTERLRLTRFRARDGRGPAAGGPT
jgi:hypothetical protein